MTYGVSSAQFDPFSASPNDDIARFGKTGIGFQDQGDFQGSIASNPMDATKFVVKGGLMGQLQQGLFGSAISTSDTWSALGLSGGMSGSGAYGLAIKDQEKIAVFNLVDSSGNLKELVAGWGNVNGRNDSYFKLNSFEGFDAKTIMFANPRGAVGVNAEPLSAIYVDTRDGLLVPETENNFGGWPGTGQLFKAITIENDQRLQSNDLISSASSIGKQGNSSLIDTDVVVEG